MLERRLTLATVLCCAPVLTVVAQQPDTTKRAAAEPSYPNVKVAGRLQYQGYYFDNEDYAPAARGNVGPKSSFFARRARIQVNGQISEQVSVIIQPSFENGGGREPNLRLRDAYMDVRLTPKAATTNFTVRFGQEKRPFSRYELLSSNNLPSIERGAGRGLLPQATNDLFLRNGFIAHDVGASVLVSSPDRFTLQAGIYNGAGESFNDNNNSKSFGVRGTVALVDKINLGASFFSHDGIVNIPPVPPATIPVPDSSFRNSAFGLDGAWGRPGDEGLFLLAEFSQGDAFTPGEPEIRGLTLVGAFHVRIRRSGGWLYAIEPVLRFDTADPNTDIEDDGARLITAVVGIYLSSRAQFRIGYERQSFENGANESISGVRSAMTVNF